MRASSKSVPYRFLPILPHPPHPVTPQIQEAAASAVAMFAGLLSADHLREHLGAVVDELMRNYDGEAPA